MQALLLVVTLGVAAGWLSGRVGLRAAVGLVALGAILGPAALGWVAPNEALRLLAEIGVVAPLLIAVAAWQHGRRTGWHPLARAFNAGTAGPL